MPNVVSTSHQRSMPDDFRLIREDGYKVVLLGKHTETLHSCVISWESRLTMTSRSWRSRQNYNSQPDAIIVWPLRSS